MTNEDQQLILTCINALGSQMAELQKKFVWLDARNEARLATMLEKLETQMKEGVLAQDIGKMFDRMEKRFDALEQRMMLDRIAAAARISSKTLGLPRKPRKAGKRKGKLGVRK